MMHIAVSVCQGADTNAAPSRTTPTIASNRTLLRSFSEVHEKVATLDTIRIAINATQGATK